MIINAGVAKNAEGEPLEYLDFLTEEEYLDTLDTLPKENQYLDDSDPDKFIAKMGAEGLFDLLSAFEIGRTVLLLFVIKLLLKLHNNVRTKLLKDFK